MSETLNTTRPILSLKPKVVKPLSKEELEAKNKIELRNKTLQILIKTYPKCFYDIQSKGERNYAKPFKKGIFEDIIKQGKIQAQGVSIRALRGTIYWYTQSLVYKRKILKLKWRIGLNGRPVELLSEEDKIQAKIAVARYVRETTLPKKVNTAPKIEYVTKPHPRIK